VSSSIVGDPISPDTNEYKWVAAVIRSVENHSGRPSRWNGDLYEELNLRAVGSAHDDGGMTVSVAAVLEPVAHAHASGRPLTEVELLELRDAIMTLVHEADHLTHELGDESAPGAVPVYSAEALVVEEGLAEAWAHRHADAVIHDLGLDVSQPELLTTESFDSYPAYTAATDELVKGTAQVCGLPQVQVRTALEQADRTQRLAVIADLVIDQRMADVVPAEDREAVRTRLIQAIQPDLAGVISVQEGELESDDGKAGAGHQSAQRAVVALSTTAAGLEDQYRDAASGQPSQGAEVEHLRRFLGGGSGQSYRGGNEASAVPDNVRQLSQRRDQGQGRE
jgi:hypothetical protein